MTDDPQTTHLGGYEVPYDPNKWPWRNDDPDIFTWAFAHSFMWACSGADVEAYPNSQNIKETKHDD